MNDHSSESCNCSRLKKEAICGILVPLIAVMLIALIVILTNQ